MRFTAENNRTVSWKVCTAADRLNEWVGKSHRCHLCTQTHYSTFQFKLGGADGGGGCVLERCGTAFQGKVAGGRIWSNRDWLVITLFLFDTVCLKSFCSWLSLSQCNKAFLFDKVWLFYFSWNRHLYKRCSDVWSVAKPFARNKAKTWLFPTWLMFRETQRNLL